MSADEKIVELLVAADRGEDRWTRDGRELDADEVALLGHATGRDLAEAVRRLEVEMAKSAIDLERLAYGAPLGASLTSRTRDVVEKQRANLTGALLRTSHRLSTLRDELDRRS